MNVPGIDAAHAILEDGAKRNPGPWVDHCRVAGAAARAIAGGHPALDGEVAYVLGLLHDIGRRSGGPGVADVRHILDGHAYLSELGFPDAAQICLTHSFPIKEVAAFATPWGELQPERHRVQEFLDGVEYSGYDRLIQLCDSLALPSGPVLLEKRLVDVALRHGFNAHTLAKWRAFLEIKQEFDAAVGGSIYAELEGVVENTFGVLKTTATTTPSALAEGVQPRRE